MQYLPHIIIGDLDSIRPEVKKYYEERNVKVLYNKDQETTDLEKCVYYVFENSEKVCNKNDKKMHSPKNMLSHDNYSNSKVIVLGAFGGRID